MDFENAPDKVKVRALNRKHRDYDPGKYQDRWQLYKGGREIDLERFLKKRFKEPGDIYGERLGVASYFNYFGQIVDQFNANLFLESPQVAIEGKEGLPDFWETFVNRDCNHSGDDFASFIKERWVRSLVQDCSFIWVDLPELDPELAERRAVGEELSVRDLEDAGVRDAYLTPVNASDLINYRLSDDGGFEWVEIYFTRPIEALPWETEQVIEHEWTFLGDTDFVRYVALEKFTWTENGWKPVDSSWERTTEADRVSQGKHGFGQVPLLECAIDDSLAMGAKLDSPARYLIESHNGIAWKERITNYALPVIFSDQKLDKDGKPVQTISEGYYLHFEANGKFEWSEPGGQTLQAARDDYLTFKTEMFRTVHQMGKSIESDAQTAGRSGEAKRRDESPTEIVLTHMAAQVRKLALRVLELVATARNEEIEFQIEGMTSFDVDDLDEWLEREAKADLLAIPSETFRKEQAKARARRLRPELPQDVLAKVEAEIDASKEPDPFEMDPGGPPGPGPSPNDPNEE